METEGISSITFDVESISAGLGTLLRRNKTAITEERRIQDLVSMTLEMLGYPFEREYRLTPQDRLDFILHAPHPDWTIGVAIEIKKGNAGAEDLRQLARYLNNPAVEGAILIAMRCPHMPAVFMDKKISVIEMWRLML